MKKISRCAKVLCTCFVICLAAAMMLCLPGCDKTQKATKVFDHVFEVETYKTLDYEFAERWFQAHNDNWGGGCTAVAKVLDSGDMVIGRNMDQSISDRCAYIVRTAVPGCYPTVGVVYTQRE